MSDDQLKEIFTEVSTDMADDYSTSDQIMERNKHLADEDGRISSSDMSLLVMSESTEFIKNFSYRLMKKLKETGYFSQSD